MIQNALALANLLLVICGGVVAVVLMRKELKLLGDQVKENSVWLEHLNEKYTGHEGRIQRFEDRVKWEAEQRERLGLRSSRRRSAK